MYLCLQVLLMEDPGLEASRVAGEYATLGQALGAAPRLQVGAAAGGAPLNLLSTCMYCFLTAVCCLLTKRLLALRMCHLVRYPVQVL
jgi:hypothetical protein